MYCQSKPKTIEALKLFLVGLQKTFQLVYLWIYLFILINLYLFVDNLGLQAILPQLGRWFWGSTCEFAHWWWYVSFSFLSSFSLPYKEMPYLYKVQTKCWHHAPKCSLFHFIANFMSTYRCCISKECSWRHLWCSYCWFFWPNRYI